MRQAMLMLIAAAVPLSAYPSGANHGLINGHALIARGQSTGAKAGNVVRGGGFGRAIALERE